MATQKQNMNVLEVVYLIIQKDQGQINKQSPEVVYFGEWLIRSTALLVTDSNRKVQLTDLVGVISHWAFEIYFNIVKMLASFKNCQQTGKEEKRR